MPKKFSWEKRISPTKAAPSPKTELGRMPQLSPAPAPSREPPNIPKFRKETKLLQEQNYRRQGEPKK